MTMTTKEVTIFLSELGQLRQDLGKLSAHIDVARTRLDSITDLFDRMEAVEKSLAVCQSTCGLERRSRGRFFHWIAYTVAGLFSGFFLWYMQQGRK
jgi:hypothetical protein